MQRVRLAALVVLAVVLAAARGGAVQLRCEGDSTSPGATTQIRMLLDRSEDEDVAGTQNDLVFDPEVFDVLDCAINPAIAEEKALSDALVGEGRLRAIIVSLQNVTIIPPGELYTCELRVASSASLGEHTIANTNLVASNPNGVRLPVTGTDCAVAIGPTPTPTPRCRTDEDCPSGEVCVDGTCLTPTRTPTPIGYCDRDDDCPEGQVCVDHQCVTPTPTRTRTPIGFCNTDDDCQPGEICVDNRCVTPTATATPRCRTDDDCPSGEVCIDGTCVTATPTPPPPATSTATPTRRKGGGGGCSCEIDPGAGPGAAEVLAFALPALALLWRRRSRRGRVSRRDTRG